MQMTKWSLVFVLLCCFGASASFFPPDESHSMGVPYAVLQPLKSEHQARIQELLGNVEAGSVPSTPDGLQKLFTVLLLEAGNLRHNRELQIEGVLEYATNHATLFKKVLPFLAGIARRLHLLFPEGLSHITRARPQKHLRKIQVLALLASSFFGIIPHNQASLLRRYGHLRLNKLDMFYRGFFIRHPKFTALFAYFHAMQSTVGGCWNQMVQDNDFAQAKCSPTCICQEITFEGKTTHVAPSDEIISFYLHTPHSTSFLSPQGGAVHRNALTIDDVMLIDAPLSAFRVDIDGDITLSDGALQVDFADKFVGGLSMFSGHVAQEELIFALRPELNVVMLFLDALEDDEALVVKGAESFVLYTGYEDSFKVHRAENIPHGSHWSVHGYTPIDPLGRRETTVVAIDALELGYDTEGQYSLKSVKRELLKASLGFQGDPFEYRMLGKRAAVATGKWGCVIFGGDNELKALLQWIAASYAGRELHYKAFRDKKLRGMQATIAQIQRKFRTTRNLLQAILKCVQEKPQHHYSHWSLWHALLDLKPKKT